MKDAQNRKGLTIYLRCLEEAKHRLAFAERFAVDISAQARVDTESACLQLRKALELIAYAAIAPQKTEYEAWHREVKGSKDYRKEYSGRKILQTLAEINPYSYPRPLAPPVLRDGAWHYDLYRGEYLTKKRYERVYNRCGRLLHADNPWGHDKAYDDFRRDIPKYVNLTRVLLNIHSVIIQHESGTSTWVIEFGDLKTKAKGYITHGAAGLHVSEDY